MLWLILFGTLVIYMCINIRKTVNYWHDRGVTHLRSWPLLGSMVSNLFRKQTMPESIESAYKEYPNAKYVGLHQFTMPVLMIRDPELIKQMIVKDFDSFMNHRAVLTENTEPIMGKNLLSLKGQKWKDMRSTLSPAFTSSKMRAMFVLITDCAEQFANYFVKEAEKENGMVTAEMKDIFTRYANDVIATAAFGIKCDSLKEKENEFYTIGKSLTTFNSRAFAKIIGFLISPKLMKLLGVKLMNTQITDFFTDLIVNTMKTRKEKGIIRPDMIHLLMEAQKGSLKHETESEDAGFATVEESNIGKKEVKQVLTDLDIVSQALIFFSAGYDTVSTVMGYMAYELAVNPEIQKKLQKEIDQVVSQEKINYENVLKMKYLDMVVSETLRKWPPAPMSERICEKPYVIETPNDNESKPLIEKDLSIWVPIYALHHDPKYFPDPEKFDPERFSDENKQNIVPFSYLPFGTGPRNCIASRFALLETKILFVHLLSKLEFTVIDKTQIPIKISKSNFGMSTEKGTWLGMKPRNSS